VSGDEAPLLIAKMAVPTVAAPPYIASIAPALMACRRDGTFMTLVHVSARVVYFWVDRG
jgi:hypothetical protein